MRYQKAEKFFEELPEWLQWLFRIIVVGMIAANFF